MTDPVDASEAFRLALLEQLTVTVHMVEQADSDDFRKPDTYVTAGRLRQALATAMPDPRPPGRLRPLGLVCSGRYGDE
jgi:hypothetical protein